MLLVALVFLLFVFLIESRIGWFTMDGGRGGACRRRLSFVDPFIPQEAAHARIWWRAVLSETHHGWFFDSGTRFPYRLVPTWPLTLIIALRVCNPGSRCRRSPTLCDRHLRG